MKKYQNFIFDFDGTLADSKFNIANSVLFSLKRHGLEVVRAEDIFPLIGKKSIEDTFLFFYPETSTKQLESLVSVFREYQRSHILEETMLFPLVRETLTALKNKGKTLHILTTKEVNQMTLILEKLGMSDFFIVVFGNGLPYGKKPEKECVEYICKTAHLDASETVMVGDSTVDIQSAMNGGIDVISVTYGVDSEQTLREFGAQNVINRFDELVQYS